MTRPLLVCLLVLLAGCGGLGGGQPTETVTPAPVPADEPDDRYPPGVAADGVVDPLALGAAHYDRLEEAPYTTVRNRTVRTANGSLLVRTGLRAAFSGTRSRFHLVYAVEGPAPWLLDTGTGRLVLWFDGNVLLRSLTEDGETRRQRFPAAVFNEDPGSFRESGTQFGLRSPDREAYWLFLAFQSDVGPVANGSTVVRGTELAHPGALATLDGVEDLHNASLHAVVGPDGPVRTYHLSYEATMDGRPVTVGRTVRYSAVGETRIERPSWHDEAVNATEE
jgi:hypothetical protein